MTTQRQTFCIRHYAFFIALAVAVAATTARAMITEEDYNADPTLIPAANASSVLYVTGTEPSEPSGEQTVTAGTVGLDATPNARVYELPFQTWLRTFFIGLYLIVH